jgi:hypothetical protein
MARRAPIQLKVHRQIVQSIPLDNADIECIIQGLRLVSPCTPRIDRLIDLLEQIRGGGRGRAGTTVNIVQLRAGEPRAAPARRGPLARGIRLAQDAQESRCFGLGRGKMSGGAIAGMPKRSWDFLRRQAVASACQVDVHQHATSVLATATSIGAALYFSDLIRSISTGLGPARANLKNSPPLQAAE